MTTLGTPVPETGTVGYFLKKTAASAFGYAWSIIYQVPTGGSNGQVLTKTSGGYAWQTLPAGDSGVKINTVRRTKTNNTVNYTVPSGDYALVGSNRTNSVNLSGGNGFSMVTAGTVIQTSGSSSGSIRFDSQIVSSGLGTFDGYCYITVFSN